MLRHVKKTLVVLSPLFLFVDDVNNEPPVALQPWNVSLSISSAGAPGIKCPMWYERTQRRGRFLTHVLLSSFFANCLQSIVFNHQTFSVLH